MVFSKRFWGTAAFCLLLLASLFLVAAWQNEGARFNQVLVSANAELRRSGYAFGTTLQQALQSDQADSGEARHAYDELQANFAEVSQRMSRLEVPELPLAKELYAAHQKFLLSQQAIIETDMGEMVNALTSAEADKQQRSQQLKEIAARIRQKHDADLAAFQEVQRAFAEQNGFLIR